VFQGMVYLEIVEELVRIGENNNASLKEERLFTFFIIIKI